MAKKADENVNENVNENNETVNETANNEAEIVTRTVADKKFIEKLEAEGTVTIVVGTEEQIAAGGYTDVGINGVFWRIKYGEKITVPKAVARLLNGGKYAVSVQGAY